MISMEEVRKILDDYEWDIAEKPTCGHTEFFSKNRGTGGYYCQKCGKCGHGNFEETDTGRICMTCGEDEDQLPRTRSGDWGSYEPDHRLGNLRPMVEEELKNYNVSVYAEEDRAADEDRAEGEEEEEPRKYTIRELRQMAKRAGIGGFSKMDSATLCEKLGLPYIENEKFKKNCEGKIRTRVGVLFKRIEDDEVYRRFASINEAARYMNKNPSCILNYMKTGKGITLRNGRVVTVVRNTEETGKDS